jgi:hypothetical protein
VHDYGVFTSHEYLVCVLIQSSFTITYTRDLLDHDAVVNIFVFLLQNTSGVIDNVGDNISLADFLGTETLGFI